MGIKETAASGDRLKTLEALRDTLSGWIDDAQYAKDIGPLSNQLQKVLTEIEALRPPEKKGTALDQLAERRRARGAETKGVDAAEGSTGSS